MSHPQEVLLKTAFSYGSLLEKGPGVEERSRGAWTRWQWGAGDQDGADAAASYLALL